MIKKLRITKEQYSRIIENKLIQEFAMVSNQFNLDKVVNDLIKYIYNDLPKFLKDKGLTDNEVINKLKEDEIIIEKNGKFSISKSFKTKDNAKKALEKAIKELTNMSDEDEQLSEIDLSQWGYEQGSPANEPDSIEPKEEESDKGMQKGPFKLLASHHDIAILTSDDKDRFFFVFGSYTANPNEIVEKAEEVAWLKGIGYGIEDFKTEKYDLVELDKESIDKLREIYALNKNIVNALESNLTEGGVNWSDTYDKDLSIPNTDKKRGDEENQNILNSLKDIKTKAAEREKLEAEKRKAMLAKHLVKPEQELDEITGTAGALGSGSPVGTQFLGPIKREIENVYETAGGVPTYDAPAFQMKKNHTDFVDTKTDAEKETLYNGGTFVTFDDCTKLNNNKVAQNVGCSTGAADGVVKYKKTKNSIISPSLKESKIIEEIARKTGKTIEEVQLIIKKSNR